MGAPLPLLFSPFPLLLVLHPFPGLGCLEGLLHPILSLLVHPVCGSLILLLFLLLLLLPLPGLLLLLFPPSLLLFSLLGDDFLLPTSLNSFLLFEGFLSLQVILVEWTSPC